MIASNSTPPLSGVILDIQYSFQKLFESQACSTAVLTPELNVLGATNTFVQEIGLERENLIGLNIFEVLAKQGTLADEFVNVLRSSFKGVLASNQPQVVLETYRHDIPSQHEPGNLIERHWRFNNTPVLNEKGELTAILFERIMANVLYQTKLQLKESEESRNRKYQAKDGMLRMDPLLKKVPLSVIILEGEELVYVDYNEASEKLFPEKPRLGRSLLNAFPELTGQPIVDKFKHCYKTGITFEENEVLIPVAPKHSQPTVNYYWNIICQALFNEQEQVIGLLIFAHDVTSTVVLKKQAESNADALGKLNKQLNERVLSKTEELTLAYAETNKRIENYHSLFMQAPVGIIIYKGKDYTVELANPFIWKLVGRTEEEILNKPIFDVLPEVRGQGFEEILSDVYEKGLTHELKEVPATLEIEGKLHDGFYHILYQPLRNANDEIEGVLGVAYEVTQQIKLRKEAEGNAEKVLFMANSMPQKVWTANGKGEVNYCNQQFLEYSGLSKEEFEGWGWEQILDPDFKQENIDAWEYAVRTGNMFQMEHRLFNYKGELRWHLTRAVPHRNEEGNITMWLGTTTEIHDHKLAEQALQELTQKLRNANVAISRSNKELEEMNQQLKHTNLDLDNFIYTASHDLKAPVSNIERLMEELMLELPKECLEDKGVMAITNMMNDAVDRFKRTIYSLTEITKLQKDVKQANDPISLKKVADEVLLDLEHMILEAGAKVAMDLEECKIISFSEKNLRSIFYNLLSNAIKYSHPERIPLIRVKCAETKEYSVLSVQDNGLGISQSNQSKLFNMFRRFHDHVDGSGIGLYMVKRILDNSNGKIEVESKEGQGTCFKVYFRKNF
jgi:two-component system, sensor histidine kinase